MTDDISDVIWRTKYRYRDDADWNAACVRVVNAIYTKERSGPEPTAAREEAEKLMISKVLMPAGRIIAGAGTDRAVTLYNCSVSPTIPDSVIGIFDALKVAALALQAGSGIGMDFSPLRPRGAGVKLGSTENSSEASGPVSYMEVWDRMSETMASAGQRRGAMMATLSCSHPDLEEFITAKRTAGRLTQFNVSVLVTDAFMKCVEADLPWNLWHEKPPAAGGAMALENGLQRYGGHTYKTLPARELWGLIMRNTYEHAEPGVIFIDRVNAMNPLNYLETISCTNPCAEQPLPPWGVCNLGHVNLAKMVLAPFTDKASIDWPLLKRAVRCGVRFLDNVVDVTRMPAPGYEEKSASVRRIGLGVTGLANLFQQMTCRYGSKESVVLTNAVMQFIANEAYRASAELAKERGPFPAFDASRHINGEFFKQLDQGVQDIVYKHGLRNGVLLSVAPTGTTSIVYDNVDGGIEPCFSHRTERTSIVGDGKRQFVNYSWGLKRYAEHQGLGPEALLQVWKINPEHPRPDWMATAQELTVDDHLAVFAAAQKWVDASISKTINVPIETTFKDFSAVYTKAYAMGCKGCTTYRPSGTRGAVLRAVSEGGEDAVGFDTRRNISNDGRDNISSASDTGDNKTSMVVEEPPLFPVETCGAVLRAVGEGGEDGINDRDNSGADVLRSGGMPGGVGSACHWSNYGKMVMEPQRAPPQAVNSRRPPVLPARVYRKKIGDRPALFVTIADATFPDGRVGPWELFVSAGQEVHGWAIGLTKTASLWLRTGGDPRRLADELASVWGADGGHLEGGGGYVAGAVAAVADALREHLDALGGPISVADKVKVTIGPLASAEGRLDLNGLVLSGAGRFSAVAAPAPGTVEHRDPARTIPVGSVFPGKKCPSCNRYGCMTMQEGCWSCSACHWSNCG